tara:strand:+ start:425 stop:859 length:435 start_codon:yes stop_codon:yes gene_type:complete
MDIFRILLHAVDSDKLDAGIKLSLVLAIVSLLILTITFRAATKWVAQQDVSFWKSIWIVVLGGLASWIAFLPILLLLELIGAGIIILMVNFVMSFCVASFINSLMLKTNLRKASIIQIVTMSISVPIIVVSGLIIVLISAIQIS